MKKQLLLLLFACLSLASLRAQVVLEDFEGGVSDLSWNGLNGTYNGVIANPGPDAVNSSAGVGSYSNSVDFDFCFALANAATPFDLSENNQIKMKIWSPIAPTKALFKMEGGGQQVEKFADITVANQWVEYTFDLSAGADFTTLTTVLVSFNPFVLGDNSTFYFDDIRAERAIKQYETFEVPSGITWSTINGTWNGTTSNATPSAANNSATVGSYTNASAFDYNFAVGTFSAPLDMTRFNQFRLHVNVPTSTKVLLKLEGGGDAIEKTKYVATTNSWQELTFDFSAAKNFTGLTKALIVFAPGQTGNTGTYLFDNLYAELNACDGIAPDPTTIEDFDCNRNAAFAIADSLSRVKNPYINGDNLSKNVGRWNRPVGTGTEYAALVVNDNGGPIDFSVNNQFSVQIWSPRVGKNLIKLEGGPNPAKEVWVDITEPNKWVTYTGDFADQVGKGHSKFVIFFGGGANGEPGDVYYFDHVKLSPPTEAPPLEDFQGAALNLFWTPLDNNAVLHGAFSASSTNVNPNAVNNSTKVGCYSKGSSPLSTLQVFLPAPLNLTVYPQINLDVLSPASGGTVRMQLVSATAGNKDVEATATTPGQWETLNFDFTSVQNVADYAEMRLIFNPGTAAAGQSWCVDNLRQGLATVDPCLGTVINTLIMDDFECNRNNNIFYGASDLAVVNNPYLLPENGSAKVGEYKDPGGPGTEYAGIGYEFAAPIDLSTYNQLQLQVYSPNADVRCMFKLEGSPQPGIEIFDTIKVANKWVNFNIDFSQYVGTQHNKVIVFINVGQAAASTVTYYIDNVKWGRKGYNGCVIDYESPALTIDNFNYFAQGSYNQPFEVVANPHPSGINTSANVGKFVKPKDGDLYTGIYADLEAPVDFAGVMQMKAKIHMDHIGPFTMKVEQDKSGLNLGWTEVAVMNTVVNEWEEVTANFATTPDGAKYYRFTLFFDWNMLGNGTSDVISYFDDISIGAGACGLVSTWHPLPVEPMKISPNPVSEVLTVENFKDINRLDVVNMMGQRVLSVNTNLDLKVQMDVSNLPSGVYALSGYNPKGLLIGKAKFVKQ